MFTGQNDAPEKMMNCHGEDDANVRFGLANDIEKTR